jgi:PAS domain S-box-containing protein
VFQSKSSDMPAISEAHLRLLLQNLGEAVFMLDTGGRVEGWTPAAQRVFGQTRDEIVGLTASVLYDGDGPSELESSMRVAMNTGRYEADSWHKRRDGTRFWAHEVMCSIRLESGGSVGFAVIVRDQTELLQKELSLREKERRLQEHSDALRQSNRELEDFASIASHDLQEPLRKILAFGDRLQTRCAGTLDAKAADYLQRILDTSQRMRQLVDDLLMYSRFASGKGRMRKVDMGRLCRQVMADLESRIELTGATIEVGELPCLMAEPTQMRQLLQNLLSNALKFVKPGQAPRIHVGSRSLGDDEGGRQVWQLSVRDHGIGFDEKYLGRIFSMLQRLHTRNEYEGTGMGLAICRRIAERHGGGITAKSKPGEGAEFIVTLRTGHISAKEEE